MVREPPCNRVLSFADNLVLAIVSRPSPSGQKPLKSLEFATAGDHIPSYLAGGLLGWGGRFITKVEAGWRQLGTVGQRMVSAERVVGLPGSVFLKAGGWAGPRDDDQTEWVAHGGLGFPLGSRFSLEVLGFLSDNGLPGGDGKRVLVSGDYRFPSGWQVTGGGAFGETGIGLSETTDVGEGFFSLSMPITPSSRGTPSRS